MNELLDVWEKTLRISFSPPRGVLVVIVILFVYLLVLFPFAYLFAYFDRKLTADLQARVGPNRAGFRGVLQVFADLVKLFQKDPAFFSSGFEKENIWFHIYIMLLFTGVVFLPLGSLTLLINTDMSALLPFCAAFVLAFCTLLFSLSQGEVQSSFGGLRVAVHVLSGAFPALVALQAACLYAGSFRWSVISESQGVFPQSWAAFTSPFLFISFCVFIVGGLVMWSLSPEEGGFSVSSKLSGKKFFIFRLGRFYGLFLWSVIAVVLYLGAWNMPASLYDGLKNSQEYLLILFIELGVLLAKTLFLMFVVTGIVRVNPKIRVDQATDLSWKILSPLSLVSLIGTVLWSGWSYIR